jgi:DNA-binding FrmR family transcriptional regulator
MSQEDIERIKALLLEQEAERLRSTAGLRAVIRMLREGEQLPNVPSQLDGATLDKLRALSHSVLQEELNATLAKLADENPARASALTKLMLKTGFLKQTNDDSSANP